MADAVLSVLQLVTYVCMHFTEQVFISVFYSVEIQNVILQHKRDWETLKLPHLSLCAADKQCKLELKALLSRNQQEILTCIAQSEISL